MNLQELILIRFCNIRHLRIENEMRSKDTQTHKHFATLMIQTDIISVREQIQEDLICLLESQFGQVDYLSEVQDLACQIIIKNFNQLL